MDFAKKLMEKYGWAEGKGLGKHESGISKPVKASLKFDNAGIGHKHGKEDTDRWWERLYNEVADNVKINKSSDSNELTIKLKNKDLLTEIKSKKKKKKEGDPEYGTFVKRSVLTQSEMVTLDKPDSDNESEKSVKINVLSDEELFAACGGRTAHKGARHGLNLKGKLARIEEQERKFKENQVEETNPPRKVKCVSCKKRKCRCDNVFDEDQTEVVNRKRKIIENDKSEESELNPKESKKRRMGVSSESSPGLETSKEKKKFKKKKKNGCEGD